MWIDIIDIILQLRYILLYLCYYKIKMHNINKCYLS